MLRHAKSRLWSMFCGGVLAGWLGSCWLAPVPTSAQSGANGEPFAEIYAQLNALQNGPLAQLQAVDGRLVVQGQVDFMNAAGELTASINSFDTRRGIIAVLKCPPEPNGQSLTVNGPALFHSENGSFVQVNDCQDPLAPTVHIGAADFALGDHTALLVTGLEGEKPLVSFTTEDLQADFSANGLELENHQLGLHSCLNAIELLVRCGGALAPAGIRLDRNTGETRVDADQINGVEASFNDLFSRNIGTFNLTEFHVTDGPF